MPDKPLKPSEEWKKEFFYLWCEHGANHHKLEAFICSLLSNREAKKDAEFVEELKHLIINVYEKGPQSRVMLDYQKIKSLIAKHSPKGEV